MVFLGELSIAALHSTHSGKLDTGTVVTWPVVVRLLFIAAAEHKQCAPQGTLSTTHLGRKALKEGSTCLRNP